MDYILNLKQSPDDGRDFIFKNENIDTFKNTFPVELDLRNDLMPVRNQGSQGTCYAQSAACMKEWQEKHNYDNNDYFSPQFFYNLRSNKYDDDQNNDEGMYGRDVMVLLKKYGICSEQLYPYGKIEDRSDISNNVYEEAKSHLIKAYAKVTDLEKTKRSLCENGPCFITFPVYNYTSEFWKETDKTKKRIGGHAVVLVGYTSEGFIVRNSWGLKWGENGYGIYKYEDWGAHKEIWTIVDEKTPLEKIQEFKLHVDRTPEPEKQCCVIS